MHNTKSELNSNVMGSLYSGCTQIAQKWSMPEGKQFTRISLVGISLLSLANTVTQLFFSICSLIPGSNSDWIKERIDIDGWAREGFEFRMNYAKGKSYSAQLILPTLFKAMGLTLNPYAAIKQPKVGELEKIRCYSHMLFEMANECAKEGMSKKEVTEAVEDLLGSFGEDIVRDFEDEEYPFKEDSVEKTYSSCGLENISRPVVDQEEALEAEETKAEWKGWVIKEIGARALYLIATLAILVEKTIYIAAGVLFSVCALGLGFKYSEVNLLAMKYLGTLDVIDDVRSGLLATVYPDRFLLDHHQRILATPKKEAFK